jgi:hypothetical protein
MKRQGEAILKVPDWKINEINLMSENQKMNISLHLAHRRIYATWVLVKVRGKENRLPLERHQESHSSFQASLDYSSSALLAMARVLCSTPLRESPRCSRRVRASEAGPRKSRQRTLRPTTRG